MATKKSPTSHQGTCHNIPESGTVVLLTSKLHFMFENHLWILGVTRGILTIPTIADTRHTKPITKLRLPPLQRRRRQLQQQLQLHLRQLTPPPPQPLTPQRPLPLPVQQQPQQLPPQSRQQQQLFHFTM